MQTTKAWYENHPVQSEKHIYYKEKKQKKREREVQRIKDRKLIKWEDRFGDREAENAEKNWKNKVLPKKGGAEK